MKRIYNKVYKAAIAALMLTAATACTSEMPLPDNAQEPDTKPETGTLTTVTVSQDAGAQTRLNYQENGSKMDVTWKTGDEIYIGVPPAQKPLSRPASRNTPAPKPMEPKLHLHPQTDLPASPREQNSLPST